MGFKVDFGGKDESRKSAVLAAGNYDADLFKFEFGESSQKKTPYIRPVFNNLVDAEDVDGNEWSGKMQVWSDWDALTFYLTPNAMWKLKKFASDLGVELPDAETDYDSLEDFVADMTEAFEGSYTVTVEHIEDRNNPEKVYAKVTAVS